MPRVSVILPVYNGQRYLAETVESVLAQTFEDFEIVAVDDGSTDRSATILQKFAARDARVRLISRPNTGLVGALNDALAAARGEYAARLDADDVCLAQRFARQVAYLDGHPECVLIGCGVMLIDPYGVPLRKIDQPLSHAEIDRRLLQSDGWALVHPAVMMRRAMVMELGGYTPGLDGAEDLDLYLRLGEHGRLANLPEVLLHYRQHYQSMNHTVWERTRLRVLKGLEAAHTRRGLGKLDESFVRAFTPCPHVEQSLQWGWHAFHTGHASAARRHAVHVLRHRPFSKEAWLLMLSAVWNPRKNGADEVSGADSHAAHGHGQPVARRA
ncbi:MAG: glycosyltransferase family 2 protein [Tepidisphaeraceae bacterium]